MAPEIIVPELSLVVLIGASGSGKSTLARRLFGQNEILSSDTFRGWVSNDENNQEATGDAFEVLRYLARKRLARGLLTVIDATNVRAEDRQPLVHLAREHHCLPVAIVVDTAEKICHDRNTARPDRSFGPHVVRNQRRAMQRELRGLSREGFRHVFTLRTPEECSHATLVRQRLWNNLKREHGPFDIIGDVHGCYDELLELLTQLDWRITPRPDQPEGACDAQPPLEDGIPRKLVFLGDLVDRGPKTPAVLRLVMDLVRYNWAADYRGKAAVIYGHTPVPRPEWFNNTICIDNGCVFGGKLTALRWPLPGTAARSVRVLSIRWSAAGHLRREAHGFASLGDRLSR